LDAQAALSAGLKDALADVATAKAACARRVAAADRAENRQASKLDQGDEARLASQVSAGRLCTRQEWQGVGESEPTRPFYRLKETHFSLSLFCPPLPPLLLGERICVRGFLVSTYVCR
jgi:hypothetical protein